MYPPIVLCLFVYENAISELFNDDIHTWGIDGRVTGVKSHKTFDFRILRQLIWRGIALEVDSRVLSYRGQFLHDDNQRLMNYYLSQGCVINLYGRIRRCARCELCSIFFVGKFPGCLCGLERPEQGESLPAIDVDSVADTMKDQTTIEMNINTVVDTTNDSNDGCTHEM